MEGCFHILHLHWKKRLQHKCFLMNFAKYLRHLFYRAPPSNSFCSTEKYLTNKIVKKSLRKGKKMEIACKEKATHAKQKLNYYLHQVFISFYYYYSKISLFLFSQLPIIYWKHEFLNAMQSYWGFIYCRKIFLIFHLKKIVFSLYDCNSDI